MPIIQCPSRLTLLLAALLAANAAHAQSGIQISATDGMLSVQASNVSATELATELSQQLGISVVVTGDAEARVNLDIVEEPLEKALAKLSPNNMLVRASNTSDIIEVVLMMGEGQDSAGSGGSDQFLPNGSPAEEVMNEQAVEQAQEASDPGALRDPNRAAQVRAAAAAASSDANLPAAQVPPMYAEEGQMNTGEAPIDPATGLPHDQQQQ